MTGELGKDEHAESWLKPLRDAFKALGLEDAVLVCGIYHKEHGYFGGVETTDDAKLQCNDVAYLGSLLQWKIVETIHTVEGNEIRRVQVPD